MNLEVPLFTMATYMNISYATNITATPTNDCSYFYTTVLGFTDATAVSNLCADSSNTFNFVMDSDASQSYIKTSIALMSVYYYGNGFNTANADYYGTFMTLTNWTSDQIYANFQMMGTGMAGFAMMV
jgi:hypothetical protein